MSAKRIDYTGQKYGRLTFIKPTEKASNGAYKWLLICDCGGYKEATGGDVKRGHISSCGCIDKYTTKEFIRRSKEVHGEKYNYDKVEYISSRLKVTITCPDHGDFEQVPKSHLEKLGCPACGIRGFKRNLQGTLYILDSDGIVKVGITNKDVKIRLQGVSRTSGRVFKVYKEYVGSGKKCHDIEVSVLRILRKKYKNPTKYFDGRTESFIGVTPEEVSDIIDKEWNKYD